MFFYKNYLFPRLTSAVPRPSSRAFRSKSKHIIKTIQHHGGRHLTQKYSYLVALKTISSGLDNGDTQNQIIDALNLSGIKTPRGLPWSLDSLKNLLKRIRHPEKHKPVAYKQILQFVGSKQMGMAEAVVLLYSCRSRWVRAAAPRRTH